MNIKMDLHTHTLASGHHTFDTVTDLAKQANLRGIEYLGITDHAPKMQGTASENYFRNLRYANKSVCNVKMLYGAELNVLNQKGEIDLSNEILSRLDFAIASLHNQTFKPKSEEENTIALLNAMNNPYVLTIGHPDDPLYGINVKKLVDGAKATNTALEISSVGISPNGYRGYGIRRLIEMILECKKKEVFVTLGSDSHGRENVGNFKNTLKVLELTDFPKELVLNANPELFFELVKTKRNH